MLPFAFLFLGCHARIMTPSASFTLLSDQLKPGDPRLVGTGSPVTETACVRMWTLPLTWWGDAASYEDLVSRALEQYDADVLLDADIKDETFGFPFSKVAAPR